MLVGITYLRTAQTCTVLVLSRASLTAFSADLNAADLQCYQESTAGKPTTPLEMGREAKT